MHVVATAGHVDHGKSTLVRALTGMEPDRWAEERRRGMTIDLGFAWTTLPSGAAIAFVDVPGHERFVPNMLAGVGPVPAALVVVAADEGWEPQSTEHLAALDALDVRHGVLAVTRSDLADPAPATAEALARIAATSLGTVDAVAVSATTGRGLAELRAALVRLTDRLPPPDVRAPVRLWVDRAFTIRGSGTVVTGTLAGGRIDVGDELELGPSGHRVRVRGLQTLGRTATHVQAVARVAVNLRGTARNDLPRGTAVLTPLAYRSTAQLDIRLFGPPPDSLPSALVLHVGSAAVAVRLRPLGRDTARLALATPLPLRIGDRALLRDPGRHAIAGGVVVLDVAPPALQRRGAAAARAGALEEMTGQPDVVGELRRRGMVRRGDLAAMGVATDIPAKAGEWLVDPALWTALGRRLHAVVVDYVRAHPLELGAPADAVRRALDLPDRALLEALVEPPMILRGGRVIPGGTPDGLPAPVAAAVEEVRRELRRNPFHAPEATRLQALGLGPRELSAAVRAGILLKVTDAVVLLPDAPQEAVRRLAELPQPFALGAARQVLGTTRRVAVPLLELLDRLRMTERMPDDRRRVRPDTGRAAGPASGDRRHDQLRSSVPDAPPNHCPVDRQQDERADDR